jgi:hypothetical protein
MKPNFIKALSALFVFLPLFSIAQCFHFGIQVTNPTCSACCDGSISITNLTGGCGSHTIVWGPGSQTGSSIHGLCEGSYSATITDSARCCHDTTFSYCLNCPTGIISFGGNLLSISVNKAAGILTINNSDPGSEIELYDLTGKRVFNSQQFSSKAKIDMIPFVNGIYLLIINDVSHKIRYSQKIIW